MEEAIELLKADGQRVSQEEVRKLWKEIENYRERNGETLSLDEMEAVSGGKRYIRQEGKRMSYSHELIAKLKKAQSPEEVAELLKTDGQDEALAEQFWSELSRNHRENADELSPDELEAVSGGWDRDWATDGCAATVKLPSWCGSNDRCVLISVTYAHLPMAIKCPKCSTPFYKSEEFYCAGPDNMPSYKWICKKCGYWELRYKHDTGIIAEHA